MDLTGVTLEAAELQTGPKEIIEDDATVGDGGGDGVFVGSM